MLKSVDNFDAFMEANVDAIVDIVYASTRRDMSGMGALSVRNC